MKTSWLVNCVIAGILGIGLCVGLGVVLVDKIFTLTQPVVDASEQFLVLLGQGNIAEAYASAAEGFRADRMKLRSPVLSSNSASPITPRCHGTVGRSRTE